VALSRRTGQRPVHTHCSWCLSLDREVWLAVRPWFLRETLVNKFLQRMPRESIEADILLWFCFFGVVVGPALAIALSTSVTRWSLWLRLWVNTERICSPCVHQLWRAFLWQGICFYSVLNKWPKHLEDQSCTIFFGSGWYTSACNIASCMRAIVYYIINKKRCYTPWGWPLLVSATDPIICARSNETNENDARIHSIIERHRHCSCGG